MPARHTHAVEVFLMRLFCITDKDAGAWEYVGPDSQWHMSYDPKTLVEARPGQANEHASKKTPQSTEACCLRYHKANVESMLCQDSKIQSHEERCTANI